MSFKDHFSGHASLYRDARPTYPPELFAWLASQVTRHHLTWDCACGNGQATLSLAEHFERTVGTDASPAQIASAIAASGVEYRVEPAEATSFADASVDLVTVAQALHWFDLDAFYAEAHRVLAPGGVLAAFTYADCSIGPEVDVVKDQLYVDLLGSYWPPERAMVQDRYQKIAFPFEEFAPPVIPLVLDWRVEQFLAYVRSWSATQRFLAARGADPVAIVEPALREVWGSGTRPVRWELAMRVGRA